MEPTYTELSNDFRAEAIKVTALLRFHGLVDLYGTPRAPKDKRSRAQREGRYSGKVNGKPSRWYPGVKNRFCESFTVPYYTPTRKARKTAWIDMRKNIVTK